VLADQPVIVIEHVPGGRAAELHRRREPRSRIGPGWSCCSFSFATLSSTGLSDVVPIRPFARSLVTIEQLAGLR